MSHETREKSHDKSAFVAAMANIGIFVFTGVLCAVGYLQWRTLDAQSRPWVYMDVIQNDPVPQIKMPFKIMAFIKNFGQGPAPKVEGCIASDTPNIHEQDTQGIKNMMGQLDKCENISQTVLMPNGEYGFDISRPLDSMTPQVVNDINNDFATFAVFGRVIYHDGRDNLYQSRFCALYIRKTGKFNACISGNEAN